MDVKDHQGNISEPESENQVDATLSEQPKPFTAADFNRAFSQREKATLAKIEKLIQSQLQVQPKEDEKPKTEKNAEFEIMKSKMQAMEKKLAEAEAKERSVRLTQSLSGALSTVGIEGIKAKHAISFLTSNEFVKYDDSGELYFSVDGETFDLNEGVNRWAKTEDSKLYQSPKLVNGSGDKTKASQTPSQKSASREDLMKALFKL